MAVSRQLGLWCRVKYVLRHRVKPYALQQFPHLLQGETFDVPEVVPFRLTHNMVHGLVRFMKVNTEPLLIYVCVCVNFPVLCEPWRGRLAMRDLSGSLVRLP